MRGRLMAALAVLVPGLLGAQAAATGATFTGTVVDSLRHPLPNAEVSLPGLALSRMTDDSGYFRLTGIPAGTHRVTVRRIAFGQLDTSIVFAEGQTVTRRITLGTVVRLDSVVVVSEKPKARDLLMEVFEESRKKGFGRFVTRDQLEKQSGVTLGSIVASMQGVSGLRGTGGQLWVASKRTPPTGCPPVKLGTTYQQAVEQQRITDNCLRQEKLYYVPDDAEALQGLKRGCYAIVYLDNSPMNATRPTMPFDLNTFLPSQLEAIEWYESMGAVPSPYTAVDARCGLLVLHRKR